MRSDYLAGGLKAVISVALRLTPLAVVSDW
jgi:hypothetical protein